MARKQSNPANSNKPFPAALRTLMEERNTSQKDLADYLGKTRQAISLYCNGESAPDLEALVKIAQYFDTSTDYLLGLYPYPHREPSAVDELGLSPATIQKIKKSKSESEEFEEVLLDGESQPADFNTCYCSHGALSLLLNTTLDSPICTMLALLARRINSLESVTIPENLTAHKHLINRLGAAADDISVSAKLTCELFDKYPELAGMFRISFGEQSLRMDIDDICNIFRRHIEDITGYRAFIESRKSKGGNDGGNN